MNNDPYFLVRLGLTSEADERSIRRAYAVRLKKIDPKMDPAAFQELREDYEAAIAWAVTLSATSSEQDQERQEEEIRPSARPLDGSDASDEVPPIEIPDEPRERRPDDIARTILDEFAARMQAGPPKNKNETDKRLQILLDDPELLNVDVRLYCEWGVCAMLAGGWRPGHQFLFASAADVFEWREDRRRLIEFGRAGEIVDAALVELEQYTAPAERRLRKHSDQLIKLLRTPSLPRLRMVVMLMPLLEKLLTVYPHLCYIVSVPNGAQAWRDRYDKAPSWRRFLIKKPYGTLTKSRLLHAPKPGYTWKGALALAVFVILVCRSLITSSPSVKSADADPQPPAPTSRPALAQIPSDPAPAPPPAKPRDPLKPDFKSRPRLDYPRESLIARHQGQAIVAIQVDAQGNPTAVKLKQSSGHERLDQAALDNVRGTTFFPLEDRKGKHIPFSVDIPFNFTVKD